jgi:hypothetical protein
MQKIRLFFSSFLIFSFLFGVFSPIVFSFSTRAIYDYREFREKIKIDISKNTKNSPSFEASLAFSSPRTTFTLIFPEYKNTPPPTDLHIEWEVDGIVYGRQLDLEDEGENISTFPLVVQSRGRISFKISGSYLPHEVELVTARHDSIGEKLTLSPGSFISYADSATHIVSRKEWWADETLRYVSVSEQARRITEWKERGETPRVIEISPEEKAKNDQSAREMNAILALDPEATTTISRKRYENGNKLIWPIQKTKKVNRIVIHHTAESLDKIADDETLLRAIYAYHARTKGWGDIGYHYVVGQRGKIYEWRAWGDYVEWAHAYGNNYGSVGISVIGNYNELNLNRDQKSGLIEAVTYVAKKYGIDVSEAVTGAYPCGGSACTWKAVTKNRFAWHRDFGNTSCPWNNLYNAIPEIRNIVVWNVWNIKPILNNESGIIESVPPEDAITYVLRTSNPVVASASIWPKSVLKSSGGKPIKIRLSYPNNDMIDLKPAGLKNPIISLDGKKIPLKKWAILSVWKVWNDKIIVKNDDKSYTGNTFSFQSDLVEILSWSRIPSWDTKRQYNDNLFRSKIIVRNNEGKLLIVNELPIEDYLKWLGEVSNSDLAEKIKTIIIGARTYAYHYTDPKNRKYNTPLYDGSDNPDEFQKYLGYGYESRSPEVVKMVDATRWEVITYGGKLIKSWYFSSSDGKTRSYIEYCQSNGWKSCTDIPYLQSVDDPAWVGHVRSGHGVGISGIGATYAASLGKTYRDIITYYLKWVKIENIRTLKK